MALVVCEECGKSISDRAPACPGCGAPQDRLQLAEMPVAPEPLPPAQPQRPNGYTGWIIFASVVVVAGLIALRSNYSATPDSARFSPEVLKMKEEQEQRRKSAYAIEYCEDRYEEMNADRKYTPDMLQFHSMACNKMRDDYRARWGQDP